MTTLTGGIFYLLSAGVILSGVLVVTSKNPINSVVYLISCFVNCAAIFILLGINLIGLIYIIVYVGAIAILFIFVIMMMDLRNISEKSLDKSIWLSKINNWNNVKITAHYPLTLMIFAVILLNQNMDFTIFLANKTSEFLFSDFTTWEIHQKLIWDKKLISLDLISEIGYLLYTDFLIVLLLTSLILLMVMIGVIALIK